MPSSSICIYIPQWLDKYGSDIGALLGVNKIYIPQWLDKYEN